jgi:N-acetylneuraminate synthase
MSLFLIAEIGINHNGNFTNVKNMIEAAADAGFDAVKFQKRTIEKVYTREFLDSFRESPWGNTQRDQKLGLELSFQNYKDISLLCNNINIQWSASAWDTDSQEFISQFNLPFNKVASPMLGHKPLIEKIALEGKYTFISTGMSSIEEIDDIVNFFVKLNCPFELMHCNSTYPMEEEDANLLCIPMLMSRYNCKVGYSGHETSLTRICVAAVALGASSLERHITLDRSMYGSDQAASIETHSLRNFVSSVRNVSKALGNGQKTISDKEIAVRNKLRVNVDLKM